jgi:hypothetical protein
MTQISCLQLSAIVVLVLGTVASAAPFAPPAPGTGVEIVTPCRDGLKLDPYKVWKQVTTKEQAEAFLREQYEKHGSIVDFTNWLKCQDFKVSLISGPFGTLKSGQLHIEATFAAKGKHRKTLWSFGWYSDYFETIWAQAFDIILNPDGQILLVESVELVK